MILVVSGGRTHKCVAYVGWITSSFFLFFLFFLPSRWCVWLTTISPTFSVCLSLVVVKHPASLRLTMILVVSGGRTHKCVAYVGWITLSFFFFFFFFLLSRLISLWSSCYWLNGSDYQVICNVSYTPPPSSSFLPHSLVAACRKSVIIWDDLLSLFYYVGDGGAISTASVSLLLTKQFCHLSFSMCFSSVPPLCPPLCLLSVLAISIVNVFSSPWHLAMAILN